MVIALTFASVPTAGVFDTDMLYRLQITTGSRVVWPDDDQSLDALLRYVGAVKDKYLGELRPAEVRVTAGAERRGAGRLPELRRAAASRSRSTSTRR